MPPEYNAAMTSSTATEPAGTAPPVTRRIPRVLIAGLVILGVLLLIAIVVRLLDRSLAEHTLTQRTDAAAIPTVAVVHPSTAHLSPDIALPGNTQAFVDTPIYARTNGYLKAWYFDIGAHVRKGQLMATIETPETDQQLQVAQADLQSAQANLNLAKTTAARYQNLLKLDSVSRQETDQAVSDEAAKTAAVAASEAAVRRLQQLVSFERIYAPFNGVVTARNTDIGQLIDAGVGSAQPRDLFRLASIGIVRVFVPVPESYSADILDGGKAYLTLDEYPGKRFEGTITRNSSAIDPNSRTLNVEVDVPNPKGLLLPGAYVFVHFEVPSRGNNVSIPSDTLIFRAQGLQVAVIRNGRVHLVPITIARDGGSMVEINSGLSPHDEVLVNPSDSVYEGQEVHVARSATWAVGAPGTQGSQGAQGAQETQGGAS